MIQRIRDPKQCSTWTFRKPKSSHTAQDAKMSQRAWGFLARAREDQTG
jgi:hypothetical protein